MKSVTSLQTKKSGSLLGGLLVITLLLAVVVIPSLVPHSESSTEPAFPGHLYTKVNEFHYPCQPRRLHLAQATNVDHATARIAMTVSFLVPAECRDALPAVTYGKSFFTEGVVPAGDPLAFNYTSSQSDGLFSSDLIYHVELPTLEAGQIQYWYKIIVKMQGITVTASSMNARALRASAERKVGETPTYRFTTPPLPGRPTSLALVGDLGQTTNSARTMMHIWRAASLGNSNNHNNNNAPTQVIIAGDMSYADSDPNRWNSWFDVMEPLLRTTPVHVAAGNHEIECNTDTNEIFVPYENYFKNPNRIQRAEMRPVSDTYRKTLWHESCATPSDFLGQYVYGNSFYSYHQGLLHIIVLNSYTFSTEGSPQYIWLEEELRTKFDRHTTPWLLVVFHAPLYTTFVGHANERESMQMKKAMEPLFIQYGVNWVVSGHDHAYMRTTSVKYGHVDPTGRAPIYFTLGAGGNREEHSAGYLKDTPEPWVAARTLQDYGYGALVVPNATHAHFHWVRDGVSIEGIQDSVWMLNPHVVA
jgi:hypothetical protein